MREMNWSRREMLLAASASLTLPALAAQIPRPAPNLKFRIPGSGEVMLSRYKGKVIGLEFLITTCPGCQRCSRLMQQMYREFGQHGFLPLGIATNAQNEEQAARLVPEYVRNLGLAFPVGWVLNSVAHEFLQHPIMQTMYVPQLVFIDRSFVIRAQYGGRDPFFNNEESNMRAQIEELLKAQPARKS